MLTTSSPEQLVKFIQGEYPDFTPEIGIILGSGLGALADLLENKKIIPYESLDGFPVSTVSGHAGKMVLGYLHNIPVVCLQGRAHGYEGTSGDKIKLMIRTLKLLGCHTYFATNAAGSLRAEVGAGELVAITDHIHFQPSNPLVGPNDDAFGPRFVSMDDVYDKTLREYLHAAAKKIEVPLHEGIYLSTLGPIFETPAEIRAFRILGADVVGMSTVPEVMVAKHCGMRVVVVSVITNLAAGMSDEKLSHEGTLHYANMASQRLCRLVSTFMDIYADAKS
jgi:xanthosine phosphorylase